MKKQILIHIILFLLMVPLSAQTVWQWSVSLDSVASDETKEPPQAFLWIPENCQQVKGVVFTQHNMIERGILEHPVFRKKMTELGFAEIWVTPKIALTFDFTGTAPKDFEYLLNRLAEVSGYKELTTIPVVPMGHSAMASFPWNFGAYYPNRTLAMVSVHGDAPLTNLTGSGRPNPDWGDKNIDGVPGLFIMGEYEWWEDRITPAFQYIKKHPNSPITLFADAGHGHFDYSDMLVTYIADYIAKAVQYRIFQNRLKPINVESGWLMDRWHKDLPPTFAPATYKKYKGNHAQASWVFDKEWAKVTEAYYQKARGKKTQYIGIIANGDTLNPANSHATYSIRPTLLDDGISFTIKGFFSKDSTKLHATNNHASTPLSIDKITGPVAKINDTLFRIGFDRLGFNNPRRSRTIWLLAHHEGDSVYKSTVQQLEIVFPLANTDGIPQSIHFNPVPDQVIGTDSVALKATADSGEKVYFYVKEGPAYIENNTLLFTKIPPKAKLPVKVTVVGWQYGIPDKIQSAEPVTQTFYLTEKEQP